MVACLIRRADNEYLGQCIYQEHASDPYFRENYYPPEAIAQQQARIEALSAEVESTENRLHEVATLCATAEQERDQLETQGEAVGWQGQWLDMSDNCEGWSSWKNIEPCDVEGWQKRKARYPDFYNLRQVFTHPAPAAPVVDLSRLDPWVHGLGKAVLAELKATLHPTQPKGEQA